jgi:uncharacterized protein
VRADDHAMSLAIKAQPQTLLRALALMLALMLAPAAPAAAQTFPSLTGRVVDDAGVIDASVRQTLERQLANLEAQTTDQLVVVTLRSLEGYTIEDYGVRLGRKWQIGQKDKNNGVLLIVAPKERKVRIEVGYGLEGVLPDAVGKYIIEKSILPRFRDGAMTAGIVRGVDDIVSVLTGDPEELRARAARAQPTAFKRTVHGGAKMLSWIPEDIFLIAALLLLGSIFALLSLVWVRVILPVLVFIGIALGLVSSQRWAWLAQRQAQWRFTDHLAWGAGSSSGSSGSSWSSGSSDSFSGGGGSFGGGGASGSW